MSPGKTTTKSVGDDAAATDHGDTRRRAGRAQPELLFRDERLVILNKPPGLPCHPGRAVRANPGASVGARLGARLGANVEDWFPLLSRRPDGPWLAHRLDTDTAGCLVVALRKRVLIELQLAFAAGRVGKIYWAVVRGRPDAAGGTVDLPLVKRSDRDGWRMVTDPAGAPAATQWHLRGAGGGLAWLELHPRTGRTHQVRAHCAALGCPVLGDAVYGGGGGGGGGAGAGAGAGALHLLARAIHLPLDPPVAAEAPVPDHMRAALRQCGWRSDAGPP